jgi:hypothetical protein
MKLAVICPPAWIHLNPLTFHMVLGQHTEPEYVNAYREKHERGDFILVDTGAAEGVAAAKFAKNIPLWIPIADEIVVPDKFEEPEGAFELFKKYVAYIPPNQRMIVPHGKTVEEWFDCLDIFDKYLKGEYMSIGVGRYNQYPGLRDQIITHFGAWQAKNVHLLGARPNPMEDFHKFATRVRSIDTGAPVAWTQANRFIGEGGHHSLQWEAPPTMSSIKPQPEWYTLWHGNLLASQGACNGKD